MHVRGIARRTRIHRLPPLVQGVVVVQVGVVVVEIVDVCRNPHPGRIEPWPLSDPVPCIHGRLAAGGLRAEIGPPGPVAGAHRRRKRLAVRIRASETAEIAAAARPNTGDEEAERLILSHHLGGKCCDGESQQ